MFSLARSLRLRVKSGLSDWIFSLRVLSMSTTTCACTVKSVPSHKSSTAAAAAGPDLLQDLDRCMQLYPSPALHRIVLFQAGQKSTHQPLQHGREIVRGGFPNRGKNTLRRNSVLAPSGVKYRQKCLHDKVKEEWRKVTHFIVFKLARRACAGLWC